jgi:hypothetical protein
MKKSHNIPLNVFIVALLLTASGCEQEQQSTSAEQSAATSALEAQIQVPLPRQDAPAKAVEQPPEVSPSTRQADDPLPTISSASRKDDGYQELEWDDLIPTEYQPETILAKYEKELNELAELDDSDPKAQELYGKIQGELDNAPMNEELNGKKVKLPGFIAPLENTDGKVSEFLLVPYFGACIHVPPPPVNQTVLVKTRDGSAIEAEKAFDPYWIKGVITTDGQSTDLGSAGYSIDQAETEVFDE